MSALRIGLGRAHAALLAALLLASCTGSYLSKESTPRACTLDSQCDSGQVCLEFGCASPDTGLVVLVTPRGETLLPQTFTEVDTSKPLSLQLSPPGGFEITSDSWPLLVDTLGTYRGLPDVTPSTPTARLSSVPNTPTRLRLPAGRYTVRATPVDGPRPPLQVDVSIQAPGVFAPLALSFPTAATLVPLTGSLIAPALFELRNESRPSERVEFELQAYRPDATPLSRAVRVGANGSDAAPFTLALAQIDLREKIRLQVTPVTGIGPHTTFEGTVEQLQLRAASPGLSLGNVRPNRLEGSVSDPEGRPVAAARVSAEGLLPGGGTFRSTEVQTDANGRFSVDVLHDPEGFERYRLLVVPPVEAPLAITRSVDFELRGTASPLKLPAPLVVTAPTRVTGRVLDASGRPVAGATVHADPATETSTTDGEPLPLRAADALTDATGGFSLSLTPGSYHFDYTAPLSTQAPSATRGPFRVSGVTSSLPELQFSVARIVNGSARGPDGAALDGALVRVYRTVPASLEGTGRRSSLIARGQVLTGGTFSVVLPAPAHGSDDDDSGEAAGGGGNGK